MTKLSACTWSAVGLVFLLACSSSKSDNIDPNGTTAKGSNASTGTGSTNAGGKGGTTIPMGSGSSVSTTNGGSAASTSTTGTGASGAGSTGTGSKTGTGSTTSTTAGGAGGSTVVSTDGGNGTTDPPPETGGSGTSDPPPATGGSGNTEDPPKGGSGNTTDPPPGDTIDPPPGDTIDPPPGDTIDPPPGDTIDPPPGDTYDPPPGCTMTEIDKVNVIVFEDANVSGADVEGRMWVGGNLTSTVTYSVNATDLKDASTTCSDWALVVDGNVTGTVTLTTGKAAYGGTLTGQIQNKSTCGVFKNSHPIDFAALETKFLGYSAAFLDYPTKNPSVVGAVSTAGGLVLTGSNTALNVFSITAEQLMSATQIKFVAPATSSIIVNVSGKTVNFAGKGFILPDGSGTCKAGTSSWCHKILWNFYEATSITASGIGIQGSVLAPFATFDGAGGNIDGQLVCKYLKGGIEYHPYFFEGCLLLPKI